MCHKITCNVCGKPTWEGCGEHIEYALEGVAIADRCHCKAYVGTDAPGGGAAGVSAW